MIDEIAHKITVTSGSAGAATSVLAYQELIPMVVAVGSLAIAIVSLVINVYFKKLKDDREAVLFKIELEKLLRDKNE
jgi:hypothetical protein